MTAEWAERQSEAFMSSAQEMTKLRTISVVTGSAALRRPGPADYRGLTLTDSDDDRVARSQRFSVNVSE